MNSLPKETHEKILAMLAAGKSIRFIAKECGVSKHSVLVRARREIPKKAKRVGEKACDWCGSPVGDKEFFRRTRRTSHKYCSYECYQASRRGLIDNDTCK